MRHFEDEHRLVVHLHHLLVELVVLAHVVFLYIRSEHIHVLSHQGGERCVFGQVETFAHLLRLDVDDGFLAPCLTVEDESAQHLLGRVVLVGRLPVELAGEVQRHRLHGADAVVPVDAQMSERVSTLLREGLSGTSLHRQQQQHNHCHLPDETAETSFRVYQHKEHREEQQSVAEVRHGDAPAVAVDCQRAAFLVLVIAALIQADAHGGIDVVHRGHAPLRTRVRLDGEV